MSDEISKNAKDLERELEWMTQVIDTRFKLYFGEKCEVQNVFDLTPPDFVDSNSEYANFIKHYQLNFAERVAIILALVPIIRPKLLDIFFTQNKTFDRRFTEFGGVGDRQESAFQPTLETLVFILAADDLELRFTLQSLFDPDHIFTKHNIMQQGNQSLDSPLMKTPLHLSEEHLAFFTIGTPRRPNFGANFPAQRIDTRLSWDDLVLHPGTRKQIDEISTWIDHGETLMGDWDMANKLRPGYRSLFYGPPGTGKTMTACLLGKATGRDVYKIDLSLVVSKYIGETEKNLAKVFQQAQNKGWILFFDEADALFGKRSETKDAHDRYANQEVSFLLQRIETFDGVVILASNFRENLDEAFTRRFESIIYFPVPRSEERLRIWQQGFSAKAQLAESLDLEKVAREHELTGGSVMNVIRYASLQSLKEGGRIIGTEDLMQGIRREYAKEGRAR